ncbi:glycerophosphodiester phosphodiesterase [bacterium]|jgi:glycerophosphoryl diester phosphodiesterase|nr:glycerophosphodiester phosphodiesterase [bacterium]
MKIFLLIITLCTLAIPTFCIEVHGHRGARAKRPENTLAAFRHALKVGTDVLELDLLVSKDGVLIVHHNPRINRKLCVRKKGLRIPALIHPNGPAINTLSLEEIKSYDCGSKRNSKFPDQVLFPGERIPTFDEVVALVNAEAADPMKVGWNIEMKSKAKEPQYAPKPREFAKMVHSAIMKHGLKDRCMVQSFDYRTLLAMRLIDPQIKTSALVSKRSPDPFTVLRTLKPDVLSVRADLVSRKLVMLAHSQGVEVVPWTVNKPKDWEQVLSLGIDGIITDDPESLISYLKERKQRK